MPISHKLKAIFIHIPKNAGSSIERTLDIWDKKNTPDNEKLYGIINYKTVLQHLTAKELKLRVSRNIWRNYFKFAVVRNPWSRAVSEYNWYLRFGPLVTFHEWVGSLRHRLKINSTINIDEIGHNIEQHKFIYDVRGKLLVDKVIRFENLKDEFKTICEKNSWDLNLIHDENTKTSSNKNDWRNFYDVETAKEIAEIYKVDIQTFGYNYKETFRDFKIKSKPAPIETFFDKTLYLEIHQDVKSAGVDPFEHYLKFGRFENRRLR